MVNVVLAFFILFFERKTASSAWAWILVLFFIPILGFVLYLLFGKSLRRNRLKRPVAYENRDFTDLKDRQLEEMKSRSFQPTSVLDGKWMDIVQMNAARTDAPLSTASKANALL